MFATLEPLHLMMDKGAETLNEVAFHQAFGRDLSDALGWCRKFIRTGRQFDLEQALECYAYVYDGIDKQLSQMKTLELHYVSPKLLSARDLELAVPGTYPIFTFLPNSYLIHVKDTKQGNLLFELSPLHPHWQSLILSRNQESLRFTVVMA
jgi:phosphatidylinositol kinase/protein kinase (PI-3  family)